MNLANLYRTYRYIENFRFRMYHMQNIARTSPERIAWNIRAKEGR